MVRANLKKFEGLAEKLRHSAYELTGKAPLLQMSNSCRKMSCKKVIYYLTRRFCFILGYSAGKNTKVIARTRVEKLGFRLGSL